MKLNKISIKIGFCLLIFISIIGCQKDFLEEVPPSIFSTDQLLSTRSGYENFMTALHVSARDEMALYHDNLNYYWIMFAGTDVATHGHDGIQRTDYNNFLTPLVSAVEIVWDWAYTTMILRSNTIIAHASMESNSHIWKDEADKNAIIAEAMFFRAYTFNMLANLYGAVPLVDTVYTSPKTDFVRSSREDILRFVQNDLEFASIWLPETVPASREGRIVKAAADHLLSEVNISLGEYDAAIQSASKVINSGLYRLMTERFGSEINRPGDVFSDLFRDGNQNRSSGNLESIYVWQFEDVTPGGQGTSNGNMKLRFWGSWYHRLLDPNGSPGMMVVDSMGRGVGNVRPNTWFEYELFRSDWDNDIRNSHFNIRRDFYYNNPNSQFFGQKVEKRNSHIDTMRNVYPIIRKVEGNVGALTHTAIAWSGRTYQDVAVFRLAETYLLRAEAYLMKGDLINAANDINIVRERSNANPIGPGDVTLDFILDERARELMVEEPRRRTLTRTGKLVERVRKYNMRAITRNTIQEHHRWWPIPQSAIDANISSDLGQNPGY